MQRTVSNDCWRLHKSHRVLGISSVLQSGMCRVQFVSRLCEKFQQAQLLTFMEQRTVVVEEFRDPIAERNAWRTFAYPKWSVHDQILSVACTVAQTEGAMPCNKVHFLATMGLAAVRWAVLWIVWSRTVAKRHQWSKMDVNVCKVQSLTEASVKFATEPHQFNFA